MASATPELFSSQALAARLDRAEGRLCASIAHAIAERSQGADTRVFEVGGGVAVFAGTGSPTNKMIGIGFDGPVDDGELERVEQFFADRKAMLQAEVSTLADPAVHAQLVRRGYEPKGFENVLGHSLAVIAEAPPGLVVARVSKDELPGWADMIATGFASPDTGGVGGDTTPPPDDIRDWVTLTMSLPGFEAALLRIDGQAVGGGSFRLDTGIAQFSGAATLPAFRRRGIQTALLRWRLAFAREVGCDIAVVVTQPASKSQQNAQREGFSLLYARQLLVKMP